ncbi:MAG: hybrid sensor histidine kinase/response regulator [Parvibaculaceae bacterium]|nr:hybrid sensor histidine kinase/response regulator [Parvibaculaceae bacterium]
MSQATDGDALAQDTDTELTLLDSATLERQQARLLYERARSSAIAVFMIVSVYCAMLTFTVPLSGVAMWFCASVVMIAVTLIQPACFRATGITLENARDYLWWHTLISSVTGVTWGLGSVFLTNVDDVLSVFTTSMMVLGITLGGVSPQSAYRRSYVGLATFVMLPYGFYILLTAPWPVSATGAGVLLGYAFFMSSSARVELATRDAIAVRQNKSLLEQLRVQRDEFQKVSDDKTRFLAATSHDLAQPLHAQGFFLAALKDKLTEPAQFELLAKIEDSWRGLGNLLDGLVDVSRLDAGAIVADQRTLDLGLFAGRIAGEFTAVADEKGVDLIIDCGSVFAQTDPILFARIIRNLLSNAIKFTDPGGRVEVSVNAQPEMIEVRISDTGCGIPLDKQDLVFDEYVQLGNRERNREKGLGLGLSIVRRLASLLKIDLSLVSSLGEGTDFRLGVPVANLVQCGEVGREEQRRDRVLVASDLCILIVDDEDAIRSGMTTLLSSWGCQVLSAGSGEDAIGLLTHDQATPDVLLIDRRLGGTETGMDVVERVRDELNEDIPVVLMTGDIAAAPEDFAIPGLKLLHKPVEPSMVQSLLAEIAERKTYANRDAF